MKIDKRTRLFIRGFLKTCVENGQRSASWLVVHPGPPPVKFKVKKIRHGPNECKDMMREIINMGLIGLGNPVVQGSNVVFMIHKSVSLDFLRYYFSGYQGKFKTIAPIVVTAASVLGLGLMNSRKSITELRTKMRTDVADLEGKLKENLDTLALLSNQNHKVSELEREIAGKNAEISQVKESNNRLRTEIANASKRTVEPQPEPKKQEEVTFDVNMWNMTEETNTRKAPLRDYAFKSPFLRVQEASRLKQPEIFNEDLHALYSMIAGNSKANLEDKKFYKRELLYKYGVPPNWGGFNADEITPKPLVATGPKKHKVEHIANAKPSARGFKMINTLIQEFKEHKNGEGYPNELPLDYRDFKENRLNTLLKTFNYNLDAFVYPFERTAFFRSILMHEANPRWQGGTLYASTSDLETIYSNMVYYRVPICAYLIRAGVEAMEEMITRIRASVKSKAFVTEDVVFKFLKLGYTATIEIAKFKNSQFESELNEWCHYINARISSEATTTVQQPNNTPAPKRERTINTEKVPPMFHYKFHGTFEEANEAWKSFTEADKLKWMNENKPKDIPEELAAKNYTAMKKSNPELRDAYAQHQENERVKQSKKDTSPNDIPENPAAFEFANLDAFISSHKARTTANILR